MVNQQAKVHYRSLTPEMVQTGRHADHLQAVEELCRLLAAELGLGDAKTADGLCAGFLRPVRPPGIVCLLAEVDDDDTNPSPSGDLTLLRVDANKTHSGSEQRRLVVAYCIFNLSFTFRNGLELMLEHIMVHRDYRRLGIGQKFFVHMASYIAQKRRDIKSSNNKAMNVIHFISLRQSDKTWNFYRNIPASPEFTSECEEESAVLENLSELTKIPWGGCHIWELDQQHIKHISETGVSGSARPKYRVRLIEDWNDDQTASGIYQIVSKYGNSMQLDSSAINDIFEQLKSCSDQERVWRLFTISSNSIENKTINIPFGFALFTLGISRWGVKMFVHHLFVDSEAEDEARVRVDALVQALCSYAKENEFPFIYFYVAQSSEKLAAAAVFDAGAEDITETVGWQVAQLKFVNVKDY